MKTTLNLTFLLSATLLIVNCSPEISDNTSVSSITKVGEKAIDDSQSKSMAVDFSFEYPVNNEIDPFMNYFFGLILKEVEENQTSTVEVWMENEAEKIRVLGWRTVESDGKISKQVEFNGELYLETSAEFSVLDWPTAFLEEGGFPDGFTDIGSCSNFTTRDEYRGCLGSTAGIYHANFMGSSSATQTLTAVGLGQTQNFGRSSCD